MSNKDLSIYSKPYLDRIKRETEQKAKADSLKQVAREKDFKSKDKKYQSSLSHKQLCMETYLKKYSKVDRSNESPEAKKERVAFKNNCKTKSDKKPKIKGVTYK